MLVWTESLNMAPTHSSHTAGLLSRGTTNTIQKWTRTPPLLLLLSETGKDKDVLFSGDSQWTQRIPEVRDDGLLVESGHRGRPVHRTDLHRKASSEGKP